MADYLAGSKHAASVASRRLVSVILLGKQQHGGSSKYRFKERTDDDYADVYRPQYAHVGPSPKSKIVSSNDTASPTPRSPTRRKTNMPTHPYSHAPTFREEREAQHTRVHRHRRQLAKSAKAAYTTPPPSPTSPLLPIEFEPYAPGSAARALINLPQLLQHASLDNITLALAQQERWRLPTNSGVHVITTFFRGTYSMARVREVLSSIVNNVENPYITAVHVLWEVEDPRRYLPLELMLSIPNFTHKLVLVPVREQPTYRQMFKYANEELQRGSIAVITNGDIYFDNTVGCLRTQAGEVVGDDATRYRRHAMALSRRHSPLCGDLAEHENKWVSLFDLCEEYTQAHDHFVFAPPVPHALLKRVDHTQSEAYGTENVVIHELRQANFSVFNYCHTVRGFHHHCVRERQYSTLLSISRVPGNARHGIKYPSGKNKPCEEMWVY